MPVEDARQRIGYRLWLKLRRFVFERDGYRCVRCKRPGRLRLHHRIAFADGGSDSPENLETMCESCHIDHHQRTINPARQKWHKFLRDVLTSNRFKTASV